MKSVPESLPSISEAKESDKKIPSRRTKSTTSSLKLEQEFQSNENGHTDKMKSRMSHNNSAEKSSPLRKRAIFNSHPTVMFTGYDDPQHQRCMKDLGAKIAMSAKDKPTVCVTDKLRRTEKFMCALGSGIPIVSK